MPGKDPVLPLEPRPQAPNLASPGPGLASRVDLKVIAAFFAIYILWGSTFLAIRVAVLLIPPWFAAGIRFFVAGVILFVFMRLRGRPSPTLPQWRNLALLGLLMFFTTYGALFWAEQFVPSGIAAVLEATLPIITITFEIIILRKQPFNEKLLAGVLLGFVGVVILMLRTGHESFGILPCLVILAGGTSWSLGAVLTRSLHLPKSRGISAAAEMMLGGAALLALAAATGELHPFPHITLRAAVALVYLITAGSLIGFTAFVWLLARMPATRVASHAYVNPVVAVALGYFVLGEVITLHTVIGTVLVIASVALILKKEAAKPSTQPAQPQQSEEQPT